jgi:ADP-ribosylglycohydrolase
VAPATEPAAGPAGRAGAVAGSLFGLAFGDALGGPTEFATVAEVRARYGATGPRDLTGDPAAVTDDTQMALAVGHALSAAPAARPEVLEPLLRGRFVAWAHSPDNNRAPGVTCLRACADLAAGVRWQQATVAGSKGCGANMRVTPVGLVPGYDLATLAGVAQLQAGMTHGHPTALAAAELTAYAVRVLLDGSALGDLPVLLRQHCHDQRTTYRGDWLGDLWQRPGAATPVEFIARGWDECLAVLDRLDAALAAPDDGEDPCPATGDGWVAEEALATALLCALRHEGDPVGGLARAATTRGDSDSIAALAGALLGAAGGMDVWPRGWARRVEYTDQLATLAAGWAR